MTEQERDYFLSILRQLKQLKEGVAFKRYASMLGVQALADNIEFLEEWIEKHE